MTWRSEVKSNLYLFTLWNCACVSFQVCSSQDCEVASGSVLAQMDLSINPCDDFYEYACSRGLRDPSEIPPDKGKWGIFSKLEKRNQAIIKRVRHLIKFHCS